jgi:predicted RND superfamily exporter protein
MKRFYALLVHWTVHRQKLLLGLIILITLILGFFAAQIELKTNFKDLLSLSEPVMRAYDRMRANYPYSSSVFIVLERGTPGDLTRAGDELAARLHKDVEWVSDMQWRENMEFFRKHSLILQKPEDLEKMSKDLADHPEMLAQLFSGFNLAELSYSPPPLYVCCSREFSIAAVSPRMSQYPARLAGVCPFG